LRSRNQPKESCRHHRRTTQYRHVSTVSTNASKAHYKSLTLASCYFWGALQKSYIAVSRTLLMSI
jgi:hypothetical protein